MAANEGNILRGLITKFEERATEFAQRVEELYQNRRCNAIDLDACSEANYNGCTSTFDCSSCNIKTTELKIGVCGNHSSVLDVTVSSVQVASEMSDEVSNSNNEQPHQAIFLFFRHLTLYFLL